MLKYTEMTLQLDNSSHLSIIALSLFVAYARTFATECGEDDIKKPEYKFIKAYLFRGMTALAIMACTAYLLHFNIRLHSGFKLPLLHAKSAAHDVVNQISFLEHGLKYERFGEKMQHIFPEGYFFIHVLFGLSAAEVAAASHAGSSTLSIEMVDAALYALEQLNSERGYGQFCDSLSPRYGIFYSGWKAYLLGKMLLACSNSIHEERIKMIFHAECDPIAKALQASTTPFLQSYPGLAWPADSCAGIAALEIYNKHVQPAYADVVMKWYRDVRSRFDTNGMLPHQCDWRSGMPLQNARGSSTALMLSLLAEGNGPFLIEYYKKFRAHFVGRHVGAYMVFEYPNGVRGRSDVDSGPVLFGVSAPAMIVGIRAARIFGDVELAQALEQAAEAVGFPITLQNRKRYAFGMMPMADAFLAWSKATMPQHSVSAYSVSPWWRLPIHCISACIVLIFAALFVLSLKISRK